MILRFQEFVDFTTKFISLSSRKRLLMHISLLSPVRKDLHENIFYKYIYNPNYCFFIFIQLALFLKNNINFLIYLKVLIFSLLSGNKSKGGFQEISIRNSDVAIVTHCNTIEQLDANEDSYYGCRKNLNNTSFIVLNKTHFAGNNLLKKVQTFDISNSFLLDLPSSFSPVIKAYWHSYKAFFYLFIKWIYSPFDRLILSTAIDSLSLSSVTNFIIFIQLKTILLKYKFKKVVITWEGYPWERQLTDFCNRNNISIYGYVHAGPFPDQISAFRFLGDNYEPTSILSHSEVSQSLLNSYFGRKSLHIGSHKYNFINNNNILNSSSSIRTDTNTKTLLVIPQGTVSEVKTLFKFALESLDGQFNMIIRLHPALQKQSNLLSSIYTLCNRSKFKNSITIFLFISLSF